MEGDVGLHNIPARALISLDKAAHRVMISHNSRTDRQTLLMYDMREDGNAISWRQLLKHEFYRSMSGHKDHYNCRNPHAPYSPDGMCVGSQSF
jgi:hypothetical protein